jgi:hypothetical protein
LLELGFESFVHTREYCFVIGKKDPWVVFFNILMLSLHLPLLFPPSSPNPNQPKKKITNEEDQKVVVECGK